MTGRHGQIDRCQLNWIDRLPDDIRTQLLGAARERCFEAGALIYGLADDPSGIFVVVEGAARQYIGRADGEQLLLRICRKGETLGQTFITDGASAPLFADARSKLRTLFIPKAVIDRMRKEYPEIERELARRATQTIRAQWRLIEALALLPLRERLIRRLQHMADEEIACAGPTPWPVIEITQAELASMLGVSRPALNKELQAMVALGAIRTSFGKVAIGPQLLPGGAPSAPPAGDGG